MHEFVLDKELLIKHNPPPHVIKYTILSTNDIFDVINEVYYCNNKPLNIIEKGIKWLPNLK